MDAVRFFDGPDTVKRFRAVLDDAGFTLDAVDGSSRAPRVRALGCR